MSETTAQEENKGSHIFPQGETQVRSFWKQEIFKGRLSRTNFIIACCFILPLVLLLFYILTLFLPSGPRLEPLNIIETIKGGLLIFPVVFIDLLYCASLLVRRSHDFNYDTYSDDANPASVFSVRHFTDPGTKGPNKYGEPQKGIGLLQILGFK